MKVHYHQDSSKSKKEIVKQEAIGAKREAVDLCIALAQAICQQCLDDKWSFRLLGSVQQEINICQRQLM